MYPVFLRQWFLCDPTLNYFFLVELRNCVSTLTFCLFTLLGLSLLSQNRLDTMPQRAA